MYVRREKRHFETLHLYFRLSVALLFVLAFAGCEKAEQPTLHQSLEDQADRIMHNASMEFTEEGLLTAKLNSEKLLFFDDRHIIWGYEIHVDFFDRDGRLAGILLADSGWVKSETREVTVYGNVKVDMDDGTRLWADSLSYYPGVERIKTQSDVRIERRGENISGNSFDSDLNFEDIRISGNVSGRLRDE